MIQLYTGVPGAGKTYKMVLDLDTFLKSKPGITLICNIDGLKLSHVNFDNFLLECFPEPSFSLTDRIERFFTFDFQKSLNEHFGGPIFYILDECQLYFPKRTSLPNTEGYFQRHRHLGHFIYLATQASKLISANILPLIELEIYAVRRSISFLGEFHYRSKSPQSNQVVNKFCHRPKKRIFELYKSFSAEEIVRPKRAILKILAFPLVFLIVGIYFFYFQVIDKKLNTEPKLKTDSVDVSVPEKSVTSFTGSLVEFVSNERVFLIAIKRHSTGQILVIDPDTNSVLPIEMLFKRNVRCINGSLTCYYDRPVGSGVVLASYPDFKVIDSNRPSSPINFDTTNFVTAPLDNITGSGNFIDSDIVPAPYDQWILLK